MTARPRDRATVGTLSTASPVSSRTCIQPHASILVPGLQPTEGVRGLQPHSAAYASSATDPAAPPQGSLQKVCNLSRRQRCVSSDLPSSDRSKAVTTRAYPPGDDFAWTRYPGDISRVPMGDRSEIHRFIFVRLDLYSSWEQRVS